MRRARVLLVAGFVAVTFATPPRQHSDSALRGINSIAAGLTCDSCQEIVGVAQQIAQNATYLSDLIGVLDTACNILYPTNNQSQALCASIAKDVANLLPWVDKQLETLAWDIPLGFCSVFIPVCTNPCCESALPEQIHLSLTPNNTQMSVTWVTLGATNTSTVQWAPAGSHYFTHAALGAMKTYTDGGWQGAIHSATMLNLLPGQSYMYRVGDDSAGWSDVFNFSALPTNVGTAERPLRVIQIGDEAYDSASDMTVYSVTQQVIAGNVDVLLHVGDVGYADGFQPHWDAFFRKIQPIAAAVPYMVVPGNHEIWFNFSAYKHRFSMPNDEITQSMYFSFKAGPVHFLMFDTESVIDTANVDAAQVAWIESDLQSANSNRINNKNSNSNTINDNDGVEWIIACGHRPLYCSNDDKTQCGLFAAILRLQVERIFYQAAVDLVIGAHEHGYERLYPVYNSTVLAQNYTSPAAPVYIVNGAAGNREGNERPSGNEPWSAVQSGLVGYASITVAGAHSLQYQFFAANGTVVDSFTITK